MIIAYGIMIWAAIVFAILLLLLAIDVLWTRRHK